MGSSNADLIKVERIESYFYPCYWELNDKSSFNHYNFIFDPEMIKFYVSINLQLIPGLLFYVQRAGIL